MEKVREIVKEAKRIGKEDPRRVIHAFKVGALLALVSSFYYYQPLYDNFGVNAMWAVITVVVVFEFSVGATLGKGLNRIAATLLAGALGIGAHHLASLSGPNIEPILLALFVFLQAAMSTFVRFFPRVKARYDYSLLIFILTFALISVSGFREDEILQLAHKRISTVIIGGLCCVFVSIFIFPVWAGQDLHSLLASNFDHLSIFLLEFGDKYCGDDESKEISNYKSLLNSKSNEESLANFAKWEPGHGNFRFRHPWKQYLAVGELIRQCGYRIDALNSYINKADIQVSVDIRKKLEEPLKRMSLESSKAMKEVSNSFKKMTKPSLSNLHVQNSQSACKSLTTLLSSGILKDVEPLQLISLLTAISLLIDIVNLTEKILESVHELASAARFKNEKLKFLDHEHEHVVKVVDDDDDDNGGVKINGELSVECNSLDCSQVAIRIDEDSIHEDCMCSSCVTCGTNKIIVIS